MSTSVTRDEWPELTDVPRAMWTSRAGGGGPLLCEVEPSHGEMAAFMRTPDGRAIALCQTCREHVQVIQAKTKAASK